MKPFLIFTITTQLTLFAFAGAWIHVDQSNTAGPWDGSTNNPFQTIAEGLDALALSNAVSQGGHTVLVAGGLYAEALTLATNHIGVDGNVNTLLTGNEAKITTAGNGITIKALVNHFMIDGFHITECTSSGISIDFNSTWQRDFTIRNCNIYDNAINGIYTSERIDLTIENCNIMFNNNGINMLKNNYPYIKNSVIAGNIVYGISEGTLCKATVSNCVFYGNRIQMRQLVSGSVYTNLRTEAELNAHDLRGNNILANPGFTDLDEWNFKELMENSPCRGAGIGGVDVGAHQNPAWLTLDEATYFVDTTTGSDSNDGSQGQPWATITNAAVRAKPGDTVIVKPGTYTDGVAFFRGGSGDKFASFKAEAGAVISAAGSANGIELSRVMGLVLEGFEVQNADSYGVLVASAPMNILRNLKIHSSGSYGVYVDKSNNTKFEQCSIYSNPKGIYNSASFDIYYRGCDIRENTGYGFEGRAHNNNSVVMDNCIIRNNGSSGIAPGKQAGGHLFNCNIVSNAANGVWNVGGYNTWVLENCIIAGNGTYGVREHSAGIVALFNCLFFENQSGNLLDNGSIIRNDANDINNNATPVDSYSANIVGNPLFRNWSTWNMRLRQASPCIDNGIVESPKDLDIFGRSRMLDWNHDYYGRKRIVGPAVDIGIYEMPPSGMIFQGL